MSDQLVIYASLIVGTLLYFLPSIIAGNKKNNLGISLVNTFLGWTIVFWVIALIWAVKDPKKDEQKLYHTTNSLIIGFLVVGPFILPAVWTNPRFDKRKKIIITIICLFVTAFMALYAIKALRTLIQYYGLPSGM